MSIVLLFVAPFHMLSSQSANNQSKWLPHLYQPTTSVATVSQGRNL